MRGDRRHALYIYAISTRNGRPERSQQQLRLARFKYISIRPFCRRRSGLSLAEPAFNLIKCEENELE